MKKRFFLVVAAVLLIGVLAGGATFALLSDSSSGHSSTFHAGTLQVEITNGNGVPLEGPFMGFAEMAPGDSHGPYHVWVKNTGSLPLVYNFDLVRTGGANAADDALAGALQLLVERQNPDGSWDGLGEQTVTQWDVDGVSPWQPQLAAGQMAHFRYTANLPLGTGNSAQAGSVSLALLISATQPSVLQGSAPVITGTWSGAYAAVAGQARNEWRFTATVVQSGDSFTGTMVELDDQSVGVTQISGTIDGNSVTGTRMYPIYLGGSEPTMWAIAFTGTIQPDGTIAIGTADGSRPWNASKH